MLHHLRPAVTLMLFFTLLTGFAYPLATTFVAQAVFAEAANGSLITRNDVVIGSSLIGQDFTGPGYLHPRPSASGWNAAATGGSNLGPTSAALIDSVAQRRARFVAENGAPAPMDAVTTSASGLDPDVSPETALAQAARIARARHADPTAVQALIENAVAGPLLGIYGQPRVNVVLTNLALDTAFPMAPAAVKEPATE